MAQKKPRQDRGRPRVPDSLRRVSYTIRLPAGLLEEFRTTCDRLAPGAATRAIEDAVKRFVARHRRA